MDKKQTFDPLSKRLGALFNAPVIILILWELLARFHVIDSRYFPAPVAILRRLAGLLLHDPKFLSDLSFSLKRLALGTVLAVPFAVALGLIMGLNQRAARFFNPLISVTYPIPKLSVLPLLMILLGIGDASKVAIIAIGIFYLVLLSVIHGIRRFPKIYSYIAQIYRIPFFKKIYSIVLKGILPDILYGCKVGIGYGLVMVVAGEFFAARNGMGFFMWNAWDQFRILDVYVGLAVFSLMGLAVFSFFDLLLLKLKLRGRPRLW
jgi:ABC-type nitrate/sulfonate/bicarbonate transport system permease component